MLINYSLFRRTKTVQCNKKNCLQYYILSWTLKGLRVNNWNYGVINYLMKLRRYQLVLYTILLIILRNPSKMSTFFFPKNPPGPFNLWVCLTYVCFTYKSVVLWNSKSHCSWLDGFGLTSYLISTIYYVLNYFYCHLAFVKSYFLWSDFTFQI